eukprot:2256386-Amphidinium_carterae.1
MRKCAVPAHMTMNRKIQHNHANDVQCELSLGDTVYAPLGLAHTPPRGARLTYETEENYVDNMPQRKR